MSFLDERDFCQIAMIGVIGLADERNQFRRAHDHHSDLVGLIGGLLDSLQDKPKCCRCDAVDEGCRGGHVREQNKESKRDERKQEREILDGRE
jgi:hypothetical protein